MEISEENSQKLNKLTVLPSYTIHWYMNRRIDILLHRYLTSHVCWCSIHNNGKWKEFKYPTVNKWTMKILYIYY